MVRENKYIKPMPTAITTEKHSCPIPHPTRTKKGKDKGWLFNCSVEAKGNDTVSNTRYEANDTGFNTHYKANSSVYFLIEKTSRSTCQHE